MRVAVVVPCFNDGSVLPEALASLLEQEPCELVVVDDGSTEAETLATLEELERDGIRVLRQPNAGVAAARMAGVAATSAPYVHPLDADDRLSPGALTELADALDADPGAAAAWGDYRTFDADDCHFPTAPQLDPWRITFLDELPGTCMVRREALTAIGGWDDVGYEDWDLWLKLAGSGARGVRVPRVTLHYRQRPGEGRLKDNLSTHAEHFAHLRRRHAPLFSARSENRRRSTAPAGLKIALSVLERVPGLSENKKRQLWALARYYLQRDMSSDCYRSPSARLRDAARVRLRRPRRAPLSGPRA